MRTGRPPGQILLRDPFVPCDPCHVLMRVLGTNGRRTHLCGAPVPVRLNAGTEPHPFQFQLHSKSPTNRSRHQIRSDQRRRRKTRLVSRPPLVRTLTMTALNKTTQTSFPFPLAHATVASAGNLLVCSEKLPDRRAHPSSRGTRPRDEGRAQRQTPPAQLCPPLCRIDEPAAHAGGGQVAGEEHGQELYAKGSWERKEREGGREWSPVASGDEKKEWIEREAEKGHVVEHTTCRSRTKADCKAGRGRDLGGRRRN